MPGMESLDETAPPAAPHVQTSPTGAGGPDRPAPDGSMPPAVVSPEQLLRLIVAAGGPWFPSAHAKQTGVPRDGLDAPLNELRLAGLVRVASWVKGDGQGFVPTADGDAVAGGKANRPAAAPDAPADTRGPAAGDSDGVSGVVDVRPPVVTPALILANLVWFCAGLVVAWRLKVPSGQYLSYGPTAVLARLGAVSAPDLLRGEWWRLLTNCFVHIGFWHLLMNLFSLGMVGSLAELLWGRWRVFAVYAVAGLAGSCLAMAHRPLSPETGGLVTLAGASGAIWGVSTSLVAWLVLFRADLPRDLVADWTRRLTLAFALNAAVSFMPGVSWEAHFGGGVAGFVAAGLLNAIRFGSRPRRLTAAVLLAAVPAVCVGGLAAAMHSSNDWADVRRRAAAERAAAEHAAFERDILPLLEPLRPEAVRPAEEAAGRVWSRSPARRADATAASKAAVDALRAEAVAVVEQFSAPPPLSEPVAARWANAKAYAEARLASLERLRKMLDGETVPEVAAWKAWGETRRTADGLWADVLRR